jgi:hypothetical protein
MVLVHESITMARCLAACELASFRLDNPGFCLSCGDDADGVEPDAEGHICEGCGESAVMGAENALILAVGGAAVWKPSTRSESQL